MPHRQFLAAAVAMCLLSGAAMTSAQAQTGRKLGQGKVPPQFLQNFDANGNGKLDPDEQQAATKYLQQMQQQIQATGGQAAGGQGAGGLGAGGRPGAGRGPGGQMGTGGGQGFGMMSPQMQQQLLQKFDANGNGQFDPVEQQAAMKFVQQMQGGGQGMGGRRGPGGQMGPGGRMGAGGPGSGMMNPQMQQQLLQKFDANGNGQLDPSEQQAAMQYVQQMQAAGGQGGGMRPGAGRGPGGAGRPGAGGPGGQAGGMNPQMQQQLLQNFDANGNGRLDPSEQQAAMQYVQQMQQQLQAAGGAAGAGAGAGAKK
ncbi:MAG TPA: hypothetical protein VIK18_24860 [Pirellulales bacterium]